MIPIRIACFRLAFKIIPSADETISSVKSKVLGKVTSLTTLASLGESLLLRLFDEAAVRLGGANGVERVFNAASRFLTPRFTTR